MQLTRACIVACAVAAGAFGQTSEEELGSKLTNVHYPPLAEQARIQGDVHLSLNSGMVAVVSGHPLLSRTAMESAKAFATDNPTILDMTYHFILVDTTKSVPTTTTVKRGNAFERAILRIFGRPTEKVVHYYRCEEGVAPPNDAKRNGAAIEIWVHGRSWCLQPATDYSLLHGP
jgi:hypothetical protein